MTLQPDYSTIDMAVFKAMPKAQLALGTHISDSMGNGCFGDAPGYPTYFTRSVYNGRGDEPSKGSTEVIVINGDARETRNVNDWKSGDTWETVSARYSALMHNLYVPVDPDSDRFKLWEMHAYQYFAHSYGDPERGDKQRNVDKSVSWPLSKWNLPMHPKKTVAVYGFKAQNIETVEISDDDYRTLLSAYRWQVKQAYMNAWRVARNPYNHLAVLAIREFYPEYEANIVMIDHPPKLFQADWWERYAEVPDPDECPGHLNTSHRAAMSQVNGGCRMCGMLS